MEQTNNPPKTAAEYLDLLNSLQCQVVEVMGDDETTIDALLDIYKDIKKIKQAADFDRKLIKEPYLTEGRKIDSQFKPVSTSADALLNTLRGPIEEYLALLELQRKEAAERAVEEAAAAVEAMVAMEVDEFGAGEATTIAAEKQEAAKQAAKEAKTPQIKGNAHHHALGQRTYRRAKIINQDEAMAHFRNDPAMLNLLEKLANAKIRSTQGAVEIPGVEIITEKRVA